MPEIEQHRSTVPSRLVNYVLVVGVEELAKSQYAEVKEGENETIEGKVLNRYPRTSHVDSPWPAAVPLFCLPQGVHILKSSDCHAGQTKPYTFVLTDGQGVHTYGTCLSYFEPLNKGDLNSPKVERVICILSHWPMYKFFAQALFVLVSSSSPDALLRIGNHPKSLEEATSNLAKFVHCLIHESGVGAPLPATCVRLLPSGPVAKEPLFVVRPPQTALPFVSDECMVALFESLSPTNIIAVISGLLLEQRVLVHSTNLEKLSIATEALLALLYPFEWPHVYIPLLPLHLLGYLDSPMPFVVGVHTDSLATPEGMGSLSSCILVHLDSDRVVTPIEVSLPSSNAAGPAHKDYLPELPPKLRSKLLARLQEALRLKSLYSRASNGSFLGIAGLGKPPPAAPAIQQRRYSPPPAPPDTPPPVAPSDPKKSPKWGGMGGALSPLSRFRVWSTDSQGSAKSDVKSVVSEPVKPLASPRHPSSLGKQRLRGFSTGTRTSRGESASSVFSATSGTSSASWSSGRRPRRPSDVGALAASADGPLPEQTRWELVRNLVEVLPAVSVAQILTPQCDCAVSNVGHMKQTAQANGGGRNRIAVQLARGTWSCQQCSSRRALGNRLPHHSGAILLPTGAHGERDLFVDIPKGKFGILFEPWQGDDWDSSAIVADYEPLGQDEWAIQENLRNLIPRGSGLISINDVPTVSLTFPQTIAALRVASRPVRLRFRLSEHTRADSVGVDEPGPEEYGGYAWVDMVRTAFLEMMIELLGNYRTHVLCQTSQKEMAKGSLSGQQLESLKRLLMRNKNSREEQKFAERPSDAKGALITFEDMFDTPGFLNDSIPGIRKFLEIITATQSFQLFIDECFHFEDMFSSDDCGEQIHNPVSIAFDAEIGTFVRCSELVRRSKYCSSLVLPSSEEGAPSSRYPLPPSMVPSAESSERLSTDLDEGTWILLQRMLCREVLDFSTVYEADADWRIDDFISSDKTQLSDLGEFLAEVSAIDAANMIQVLSKSQSAGPTSDSKFSNLKLDLQTSSNRSDQQRLSGDLANRASSGQVAINSPSVRKRRVSSLAARGPTPVGFLSYMEPTIQNAPSPTLQVGAAERVGRKRGSTLVADGRRMSRLAETESVASDCTELAGYSSEEETPGVVLVDEISGIAQRRRGSSFRVFVRPATKQVYKNPTILEEAPGPDDIQVTVSRANRLTRSSTIVLPE